MLRNMNIYQIDNCLFNLPSFLSKDPEIISRNEIINSGIAEDVFHPKLSREGLRQRQQIITGISRTLLFLGGIIFVIVAFPLMLFSAPWLTINIAFCAMHYCIGAAMYIALIRGCRASIDEIKFKRQGMPNDFKINQRAYVRGYDFLFALPTALFPLLYF